MTMISAPTRSINLMRRFFLVIILAYSFHAARARADDGRWSVERAKAWQESKPWFVGCNFNPSTAINQLEMWQADSFDLKTIDRELGWAEDLGFTSVRVFLHHMLWDQDKDGFLKRMDEFLEVAAKHKIGVMFVIFDAVWDPHPKLGPQRAPVPYRHNSGWVQSPGVEILKDPGRYDSLKPYVQGVVGHFKNDPRIDAWDLFNEPDNRNVPSYDEHEPANKAELSLNLLTKEFAWAREVAPSQPLTAGVWIGDWSDGKLSKIDRFMLENSDIITFHNYSQLDELKSRVETLRRFNRPLVCTEYMARPNGSTFDPMLGYFKSQRIGAYNWGFVAGKTQTIYPWDTWTKKYDAEPPVWFHDIFRADGTPYDPREVAYIKSVTGKAPAK
jgi:hypothetical protein